MKRSQNALAYGEFSSHEIRATALRLAHPDDPLAEWHLEFEEWRKAFSDFQRMEQEQIVLAESPGELTRRHHRYLLFLLMARGEHLAIALMKEDSIRDPDRAKLLRSVDTFLGSLRDSWHTWHGEALPDHREALAKFLS